MDIKRLGRGCLTVIAMPLLVLWYLGRDAYDYLRGIRKNKNGLP